MIDGKESHDDKQPYSSYKSFVSAIIFSYSLLITTSGDLRLVVVVVGGGNGAESTTTIGR